MPVAQSPNDIRARLKDAEAAVSKQRGVVAACRQARDEARNAFAKSRNTLSQSSPEFKAAQRSVEELNDAEDRLEELQAVQIGILEMIGGGVKIGGGTDRNGPRSGDSVTGDGWSHAAHELDLAVGRMRVDMPARDLLAAVTVTPSEGLSAPATMAPFVPKAQDRRFLYPEFPRAEVEHGDLAITEFKQTGSRNLSGDVERDPVATTEKAKLSLGITLETPALRQFAAVIEEVPSKLFEAIPALEAFLQNELQYQLDLAVDEHTVAQIAAATPAHGKTGAGLIERVRNGVSAMRALGAQPSVLALSPTDAAALDLTTTGADKAYVFATRDSGSASPLWSLRIVESPTISAPLLLDPALLGVFYSAMGTILADPYTGLTSNQVRVRVEIDGLLHVRDVSGAYLIE
ncbi:MAG: hypothetical protein JWN32_1954 [Solirubrobacterales bacterium]|jgi:hypothetical protein|nr:hypothetical protein [Solirubrobacterales bacterium]